MTTTNIPVVTDNKTDKSNFNNIIDGLTGDIYPRISGAATDLATDLGSETYKWISASIKNGHIEAGMIIPWMDYSVVPIPQGWMRCANVQVNKTTYDAQHSAGDWDKYIGSSILEDKFLPYGSTLSAPFYLKGSTGTLHNGSDSFDSHSGGNHTISFSHNHSASPAHSGTSANRALLDRVDGDRFVATLSASTHTHDSTIGSALTSPIINDPKSVTMVLLIKL